MLAVDLDLLSAFSLAADSLCWPVGAFFLLPTRGPGAAVGGAAVGGASVGIWFLVSLTSGGLEDLELLRGILVCLCEIY